MSRDDPRGRVPVRPPAVRRERRASLSSLVRRGAPLEVTRGLHVMGRDGGKGGLGRGRRSDDKGGNGRVKMVDREIEALEAAIEVRRRSAADGTAATFSGTQRPHRPTREQHDRV